MFRINTCGWFLTYPKCSIDPQEALDHLLAKGRAIQDYVIAQEPHADGTPHLHAFIKLSTAFNCRDPTFWDLKGHHGNYQSAKSWAAVIGYCKKGASFISSFDVEAKSEAQKKKRSYVGQLLLKGVSLSDIMLERPDIIYEYGKLQQNWALYQADLLPSLPRCVGFIPNKITSEPLFVQIQKQRHYWFWSAQPNKGKTTFLLDIQCQFPSFWYNLQELYQVPHPQAQFILLDEYSTGHLKITQLNSMADGTYQYPVKGGHAFTVKEPIILVCGNKSPLEIYTEPHHELLKARFNIINLD